ncbi:beta-lactamase family protein [Pikeienuella piscinae]|uniref:Beta-lactamase family protein n=1 Tax=Pikeienuella piscinae TaxID=2748098 RepID=A0A7L5BSQ3_9RHOB|nr:serine hydrolase domain-containing protein [Pikeienuella piscinae]QIE54265.1 beta-lactamase family protein [Pikeienuella piscinae]
MAKPIVSVIALQLVEEGRLQLFHPVTRYLPAFEAPLAFTQTGPRRAGRRMLVYHLMTHTAELSYGFMGDATGAMMNAARVHADASVTLGEEAKRIARIPLQFEPGSRFLYSVATDVLGALIEEVEGAPLGEIVAKRVTGPLGMNETSFCPGAAAEGRVAPLVGGVDGGLLSSKEFATTYPHDMPGFARGGHGLFSTLEDSARFAGALLLDARGGGAPRLLSQATLAHATRNHCAGVMPIGIELPPNSVNSGPWGQGFGLGFAVSQPGGPLVSRPEAFGWSGAAETWFTVDPASDLFVVLMAQNFNWPGASFDLQNMAYAALTE